MIQMVSESRWPSAMIWPRWEHFKPPKIWVISIGAAPSPCFKCNLQWDPIQVLQFPSGIVDMEFGSGFGRSVDMDEGVLELETYGAVSFETVAKVWPWSLNPTKVAFGPISCLKT